MQKNMKNSVYEKIKNYYTTSLLFNQSFIRTQCLLYINTFSNSSSYIISVFFCSDRTAFHMENFVKSRKAYLKLYEYTWTYTSSIAYICITIQLRLLSTRDWLHFPEVINKAIVNNTALVTWPRAKFNRLNNRCERGEFLCYILLFLDEISTIKVRPLNVFDIYRLFRTHFEL